MSEYQAVLAGYHQQHSYSLQKVNFPCLLTQGLNGFILPLRGSLLLLLRESIEIHTAQCLPNNIKALDRSKKNTVHMAS